MTRLEDADYPAGTDGALSKGGRSRLHGHPKHVKGQFRKGEKYNRSSAMSDTSEAPSIASHAYDNTHARCARQRTRAHATLAGAPAVAGGLRAE